MCSPVQVVSVRQGGCDGYTPAGRARAFLLLQSLAHTLHGCSFKVLPFRGGSATSQGMDEVGHLFTRSPAIWRSASVKPLSSSLPLLSFCLFLPDL